MSAWREHCAKIFAGARPRNGRAGNRRPPELCKSRSPRAAMIRFVKEGSDFCRNWRRKVVTLLIWRYWKAARGPIDYGLTLNSRE